MFWNKKYSEVTNSFSRKNYRLNKNNIEWRGDSSNSNTKLWKEFTWQRVSCISIFLNSSYRRMFLAGSATLGGTGGAGHVHPPTFKETKVFFLLVLPRFTSWNWLVWITFSSVLTMGQCLPLHVTLYFKLTIFPVCLVYKLHGNACAPRLIVYLSHTKLLTSHSRSHFQSMMKS